MKRVLNSFLHQHESAPISINKHQSASPSISINHHLSASIKINQHLSTSICIPLSMGWVKTLKLSLIYRSTSPHKELLSELTRRRQLGMIKDLCWQGIGNLLLWYRHSRTIAVICNFWYWTEDKLYFEWILVPETNVLFIFKLWCQYEAK